MDYNLKTPLTWESEERGPEEDEDEGVEEEVLVEHLPEGVLRPPLCQLLQLGKLRLSVIKQCSGLNKHI